jgi:hypothetical protein
MRASECAFVWPFVGRARLPPGLLLRERRGHGAPVVEGILGQGLAHGGEAGAMREQVAHRKRPLPRRGEPRPVVGHRGVEVELPLVDELVGRDRRDSLGGGIDVGERGPLPRLRPLRVDVTSPEIDDGVALDGHAQCHPHLRAALEAVVEYLAHALEAEIAVTLDRGGIAHRSPPR